MSYEAREGEVPPVIGPPQIIPAYQGVPQLFIEEGTNNHLLYRIGSDWWDAVTLTPNRVPLGTMRLQYLMEIRSEEYRSHPVFVSLENDWEVFSSDANRLLVHSSNEAPVELRSYPDEEFEFEVEAVTPFLVPAQSLPPVLGHPFPQAQLPSFSPVWMERLTDLATIELLLVEDRQGLPWYQIGVNFYEIQRLTPNQNSVGPVQLIEDITNFDLQSQPVLVKFGRGWSLYHTPGNRAALIGSTADEPSPVMSVQVVSVPVLPPAVVPGSGGGLLPRNLPPPDPAFLSQFTVGQPSPFRAGLGFDRSQNQPVYVIGQHVYRFGTNEPLQIPVSQVDYIAHFNINPFILVQMPNSWAVLRWADSGYEVVASSLNLNSNDLVMSYQVGPRFEVGRLGESRQVPTVFAPRRLDDSVGHPLSELLAISLATPSTPPHVFGEARLESLVAPSAPTFRRTRSRLAENITPIETPLTRHVPTEAGRLRIDETAREALEAAGFLSQETQRIIDARTSRPADVQLTMEREALEEPEIPSSIRRELRFTGLSPQGTQRVLDARPVARRLDFPEAPSEGPSLHRQSVETLMRQLYGLPVTLPHELVVNRLQTPFVTFDRAVELIQSGQVRSFILDPLLQPWAGPPTSPNRIITLILNDGTTALVRAHFNPVNNNILPPV